MRHSRAYYVVLVGIGLLTLCEPFVSTAFVPNAVDGIADVIWLFVQGAAVFCVARDVFTFIQRRRRWSQHF